MLWELLSCPTQCLPSIRPAPNFAITVVQPVVTSCRVLKLLSEDPGNYSDAPREGIRRVLEEVTGTEHPRDHPLDTSRITSIRMGTTVQPHVPAY